MRAPITAAGAMAAGVFAVLAVPPDLSAQQIDDQMRPMAGEYRSNLSLISVDMPDAPPQVADMMQQIMSREFTFCLTEQDVEEGFREALNRSQQGDCSYQRFRAVDGVIDAQMTCEGPAGEDVTMTLEGTGSPTSADFTMTMSGNLGMGPGSMVMRVQQGRIGSCS